MKYNDNWKYLKQKDDDYQSDRLNQRKRKAELIKFRFKVPDKDKIWFDSLNKDDQYDVARSHYSSIMFGITIGTYFWDQMKIEHPGDLQIQRKLKLVKILK